MRTAGFVLVGGRSARMGKDKALLPWRSGTLVEHVAAKVRECTGNVVLIGKSACYGLVSLDCLSDLRAGLGPLAGIETSLASGRGELNLILACDLPFIEAEWLKVLLHTANDHGSRCVVAADESGRVHPLCAVYRSDCLPVVRSALDAGRLKLMEIIQELDAEHVQIPAPIWNVNTPEEWQLCQELAIGR